jgi:putative Mg2+ transporter-C (MgtC) family protein
MIRWDLLLRIAVATVLGGAIGLERDRRGRPAGLRTHMVVALASATFMVVSTHFIEHQHYASNQKIDVDVSRIAASIVTGIGFLGGGAIMRTGLSVQGLTTAAGLWLVGAIGMAAGGGMYVVALFSTGVGLIALDVMRRLEDKDDTTSLFRVEVQLDGVRTTRDLVDRIGAYGARMHSMKTDHDIELDRLEAQFDVRLPKTLDPERLIAALEGADGVRRVRIERTES